MAENSNHQIPKKNLINLAHAEFKYYMKGESIYPLI